MKIKHTLVSVSSKFLNDMDRNTIVELDKKSKKKTKKLQTIIFFQGNDTRAAFLPAAS